MTISHRAIYSTLACLLFFAAAFFSMPVAAEAKHYCGHKSTCAPPPAPAPTASYTYSPTAPAVGQAVSFDGRGSSCEATPCTYRWEDGATVIGTGSTLTHSFSTAGSHQLKLTVTDAQSRVASTTKTITVSEPATSPSPTAVSTTKTSVAPGEQLTVNWAAPEGSSTKDWISVFEVSASNNQYGDWKYTNGATSGAMTLTAPSTAGDYELRYLLNDGYESTARSAKITVTATPVPTAAPTASYTYSPSTPVTGQEVTFDGTGSSCSAAPCSYTWEDDGADGPGGTQYTLGSGETLKFTFNNAGGKNVRLTVTDAQSRSASTVKTITVSAPATVNPLIWSGGFEPGDLSEWGLVQTAAPDRAQIVTSPVTQGTYALKLTVKYGDVPTSSGSTATNRAQINGPTIHQEGEEDYTRVSMRVPSGFPVGTASNDFQLAWQWHGAPHTGSPPISINMNKDRSQWQLAHNPFEPDGDVNQPQSYRAPISLPLTKDVWHHFIYRVKWSRYSSVGFFEVWHAEGGQEPVKLTVQNGPGAGGQRVPGPTLHSNMVDGLRPIAANYRRQETTTQDGTIFYDGVAVGDSFLSVWP